MEVTVVAGRHHRAAGRRGRQRRQPGDAGRGRGRRGDPPGRRAGRARGLRAPVPATASRPGTPAGRRPGAMPARVGDPRRRPELHRRRAGPVAADVAATRARSRSPTSSAPARWRSRWSAPGSTAGPRTTPSTPRSRRCGPPRRRCEEARLVAFDAATYDLVADRGWSGSPVTSGCSETAPRAGRLATGLPTSSEVVDHEVDAAGEGLDVGGVDGGVHRDPELVAAELAVGLGVDDAVGPQHLRDGRGVDARRRGRWCR